MVLSRHIDRCLQIRLLPNRSATWRQTLYVLAGLNVVSLSVGVGWALRGAWVILPFAGLEVVLLTYLVYRVMLNTYKQEVVYIEPDAIRVESGISSPVWTRTFDRNSSEFVITHPRHSLSPAEISIDTPEQSLRVGLFLNPADSDKLVELIRYSGARYRFTGKTLIHAIEGFDL